MILDRRSSAAACSASVRSLVAAAVAAAALVCAPPSFAEPSAADKETARAAWAAGLAKRAEGDHTAALKLFRAADALMALPTTGLEVARELAALGQVVEARDAALIVAKMMGNTAQEKSAAGDASKLYEALGKRVATIVLTIAGAPASGARVRIDGVEVPAAALAAPRKVNPGTHTLLVEADGCAPDRQTVSVAEGGVESVAVLLVQTQGSATQSAGGTSAPQSTIPAEVLDMIGKYVVLTTKDDRTVEGRLISADDTGFQVEIYDGQRVATGRKQARSIRLREGDGPETSRPETKSSAAAPPARSGGEPSERPGVIVRIDSNDTGVSLYRLGGSSTVPVVTTGFGWSPTGGVVPTTSVGAATFTASDFVCRAPCDTLVDGSRGDSFFLAIDDHRLGPTFLLRGLGSEVLLTASVRSRPSNGARLAGTILLSVGIGAVGVGFGLIFATLDNGVRAGGVASLLGGTAAGLLSIPVFLHARGDYDVNVPQNLARALLPTTVAFTPPSLLPGGGQMAGLSASWEM